MSLKDPIKWSNQVFKKIILQLNYSILTLPDELFKCSHWVEFLISWLDQLQQGRTDWQKYPKNRQSIRQQQPEPLENKMCHAFPEKGVRLESVLLLTLEQPFSFLFCAKGFNSPQAHSNPSPGLWFGSDTRARAHCWNTGQLSSSCLFLNWVAVRSHTAASSSQPWATAKSKWRPGTATAWLERVAAQGQRPTFDTSDQVRPREDFLFSFLWERF